MSTDRIPDGWTEEQLRQATVADILRMSSEELYVVDTTIIENNSAASLASRLQLDEHQRIRRVELGLPPVPGRWRPNLNSFGLVAEENGSSQFGIPEGCTEERLRHATVQDIALTPAPILLAIDISIIENIDAAELASVLRLDEAYRVRRAELGLPPLPGNLARQPNVDPIVQVVEENGNPQFGFFAIRLDYSDDERFTRWIDEFEKIYDKSLEGSTGAERILDRLTCRIFQDEGLAEFTFAHIRRAYPDIYDEETVPPGVGLSMCLAIDKEAMDSLLEPIEGQLPWVWAVDLNFDFDSPTPTDEDGYPGYFKVAISSLIPDLYPMLAGPEMPGSELWPFADPIWTSAFGFS